MQSQLIIVPASPQTAAKYRKVLTLLLSLTIKFSHSLFANNIHPPVSEKRASKKRCLAITVINACSP